MLTNVLAMAKEAALKGVANIAAIEAAAHEETGMSRGDLAIAVAAQDYKKIVRAGYLLEHDFVTCLNSMLTVFVGEGTRLQTGKSYPGLRVGDGYLEETVEGDFILATWDSWGERRITLQEVMSLSINRWTGQITMPTDVGVVYAYNDPCMPALTGWRIGYSPRGGEMYRPRVGWYKEKYSGFQGRTRDVQYLEPDQSWRQWCQQLVANEISSRS